MADPFVAEIRIFPFNFAPQYWAFCNGQIIPIQQNTALFSLIGTTYGGDGIVNFGLPDLQGRIPMHPGQGPGLSDHVLGESGGAESVTLLPSEMPGHTHTPKAQTGAAEDDNHSPTRALTQASKAAFSSAPSNTTLAPESVTVAGGSLPHNNMQPYLALNFCIALYGVFPPRP